MADINLKLIMNATAADNPLMRQASERTICGLKKIFAQSPERSFIREDKTGIELHLGS